MATTLSQIRSLYSWNDKAQRWMVRGRFVSESSLKLALVQYSGRAGEEIKQLAAEMSVGSISVEEWQLATADRIKNGTLAMELAAKGGRLTARDYGRIGSRIRTAYRYLQGFALDVEAGRLSAGQIVARAGLYAAGFNGAYERARRDEWQDRAAAGVAVDARNVLAAAEHCQNGGGKTGCQDEAARGWVPLHLMSTPGGRRCRSNCLCRLEFRVASFD